jgi:hypothetical protein
MYQYVAILPQASAMNEVIAHGKELREVLKASESGMSLLYPKNGGIKSHHLIGIIGRHDAQIMLLWIQVLGIIVDSQYVCYSVHFQLI